jgi:hypothetical protein
MVGCCVVRKKFDRGGAALPALCLELVRSQSSLMAKKSQNQQVLIEKVDPTESQNRDLRGAAGALRHLSAWF